MAFQSTVSNARKIDSFYNPAFHEEYRRNFTLGLSGASTVYLRPLEISTCTKPYLWPWCRIWFRDCIILMYLQRCKAGSCQIFGVQQFVEQFKKEISLWGMIHLKKPTIKRYTGTRRDLVMWQFDIAFVIAHCFRVKLSTAIQSLIWQSCHIWIAPKK